MAFIGFACKTLACFSVAGALISYPYSQVSFPKKRKAVILGLSDRGGSDLSLTNMEKVNKLMSDPKITKLSVNEVGMKMGGHKLSSNDILINPCIEEDKYYLLKYDSHSRNYKLTNGISVPTLNCVTHKHLYEKLDYVSLKWANRSLRVRVAGRKSYLPTIRLNSCFFYKGGGTNVKITCNAGSWSERIQGVFEASQYEPTKF